MEDFLTLRNKKNFSCNIKAKSCFRVLLREDYIYEA